MQNLRVLEIWNVVYEIAVAPLERYLKQLDISDASQLYRRVELDFLREYSAEEQAFLVGDCGQEACFWVIQVGRIKS